MAKLSDAIKHHYHFIGIGGMGMGALAAIMLGKGFKVSGSDVKESLNRQNPQLKNPGEEIYFSDAAQRLGQEILSL